MTSSLEQAADRPTTGIGRRRFVAGTVAGVGAAAFVPLGRITSAGSAAPHVDPNVFSLGVASGDPGPDRVTLWTRLAPDPLNGGGMGTRPVRVRWEVAHDEAFTQIAMSGTAGARAEFAHAVKVRVQGLQPDRWYWFRFIADGLASPVGRTRTTPLLTASVAAMRFAFASCQSYTNGYFTAYAAMAEEDLDLVVHLGDYIYEGGGSNVRAHNSEEVRTLAEYRNRHALYKLDPDLQLAHSQFPFVNTWDDHEAENNYAGLIPENPDEAAAFPQRRADAYRAWWEHIPIRSGAPTGPDYRIYRRIRHGRLVNFHMLDGRQYRSDQECENSGFPDVGTMCAEGLEPTRSMLGAGQEQWLADGLVSSPTRWNVLANDVIFAPLYLPGNLQNMDQWDGYPAARLRALYTFLASQARNPVVITGDIHVSGAADVRAVPDRDDLPVIASEYVGPGITSSFPANFIPLVRAALNDDPRNAHIKYFDDLVRRGYVRCNVTPAAMNVDFRYVSTVTETTATVSTGASFVTEAGNPGVQPA